jgi:PEP-CTERM motif
MARLSALVAVVAALAVAPVQAASFASASMSDFRITLFDLNPTDGITPRITFPSPYQGDGAAAQADNRESFAPDGTGPFNLNVATALSSARAVFNGTGPTNITSMTTSGSARGAPGSSYSTNASMFSDFTVTANTRVEFSALAKAEATTTIGQDPFGGSEQALAGAFFNNVVGVAANFFPGESPGTVSSAGVVTLSFSNLTGGDMVGGLDINVGVQGFSSTVPEPETYAMMVAGLGLLSFMLRRRRAAARLPGV